MEGEDLEVCALKKGQDWAPGEKIRDILGIGGRWDHSQHSPKSYIFHSNLYELRACSITEKIQYAPIHLDLLVQETLTF